MIGLQPLRQPRRDVNYARRQQFRRLSRAGRLALSSAVAAVLGLLLVVSIGFALHGAVLLAIAAVFCLRAHHWLSLARRSGVGARSEVEVRRVLALLQESGWRLRHGVHWRGPGDIDSIAVAPTGVGFAIETKTRSYDEGQLDRVHDQAAWLGAHRRRWCGHGAFPVLCVVRAAGVERSEHGVLVVSIDQLLAVLLEVAGDDRAQGGAARRTGGAVERRR